MTAPTPRTMQSCAVWLDGDDGERILAVPLDTAEMFLAAAQEARERAEQAMNGALEENASLRQRYNPPPCNDERAEKFAANDELESMKRDRDSVLQSLAGMFERAQRAEALAESYKADAERLDWLHARAFTIYRTRDPESKALSIHVTIVDEDAKGTRTGITAPTIRAAIDSAMATRV